MDKDKVLAELDELDEIKCTLLEQGEWSTLMRVVFRHVDAIRSEVGKSSWIKVGERLPEDMEFVNVVCSNGLISASGYSRKHSIWDIELPMECDYTVTHWMPLPEPPEESKQ